MISTDDKNGGEGGYSREYIEEMKAHAKKVDYPYQVMIGTAPQEMLNAPEKYNWDGSLKSQFKRPDGEAGGGKLDVAKYRRK